MDISRIMGSYSAFLFIYFFIVNAIYLLIVIISYSNLKDFLKVLRSDVTVLGDYTKPISIIVPAFNEQETIIDSILSLMKLDYPEYQIIVVNDGSKDETLQKIISYFKLRRIEPETKETIPTKRIKGMYSSFENSKLVVLDKENGGKSDALNAGINISIYPLFCSIDADSILEKNALQRIVKPFLNSEKTIAVGGNVRIANGSTIYEGEVKKAQLPKKPVEVFQIIEYYRAFLTNRVGFGGMNSLLIISGAFGLFKKSAVFEVGGYKETIGEDMELILRLHRYYVENNKKYRVMFVSDAVCWTEAPRTLKGLKTQRVRWHRGLADTLLNHKTMFFNIKYGLIGIFAYPYFLLVELLGPVFELIGYLIMIILFFTGRLPPFFVFLFIMAYLFATMFSLSAILFEQISYKRYKREVDILKLIIFSFLEQFSYRQITVWWRVSSFLNYKKGKKTWGNIQKKTLGKGK